MENGRFSFVLFFVFFLFRFPLLSLGFGCETCSIHFFPFSAFTPYWFVFSLMGSDWTRFFKNCFFGESSPTDCVFIFVRRGRFCGVPSFRFLSLAIFAVFFSLLRRFDRLRVGACCSVGLSVVTELLVWFFSRFSSSLRRSKGRSSGSPLVSLLFFYDPHRVPAESNSASSCGARSRAAGIQPIALHRNTTKSDRM